MQDQSQKCVQKTLWDTDSVIGTAVSQAGQKPLGSQESQGVEESGQKAFPVNPYRVPVNSEVRKTNGTSGLNHTVSSASVALASFLVSNLEANLDVNGSMEYFLIWKNSVLQSQRQICQLRASAHRISGNDSTGALLGWPTPNTMPDSPNMSENRGDGYRKRLTPQSVAGLVGWPTPRTVTGGAESAERKQELGRTDSGGSDLQAVALLAGWGTPRVTTNGGISSEGRALLSESRLEDQVQGWSTPSARDWKDTPGMSIEGVNPDGSTRERLDQLPRQIHGATGIQCSAEMERRGVLDAQFSRWLMAFPESWDHCSPNWKEWDWMQSVLQQCVSGQEVGWRRLAEIVLADYEASETQ